jgi:tetratricopeptide (TPR) repeat protein/predicted Ser/Thr protein kinase
LLGGSLGQGAIVSEAFETIVGKVCVERGWVTRDQLVDCLRECATNTDLPLPESSKSRLSDMLVAKGLVTRDQIATLREEVSRILANDSAYTVVRKGDTALGQILVTAGACSKEHVIEALSIQQHLADRGGAVPRLGEILIQKGYATFAAIEDCLNSQKEKVLLHCVSCRSAYAVVDFSTKKKYVCKKCAGALLPPGEMPADIPEVVTTAQKNAKNILGKYVVVEELGRGGMGVVYKAWESGLKRWVALKVLAGTGGKEDLVRFRREAQTAASLRHPNIVGIYEVGDVGEKHVIAMEYVDGDSLAGQKMPAPKAAAFLAQVARAVEFAHSKGIVHRDIKPHNIMIDREGKAFVMDFGLAKSLQASSHITMSGTVVGTPSYMAPEQAAGKIAQVGKASDVYSLGAVLYEVLTGLPPFKGPNPVETLRMVVNEEVVPPSRISGAVPKDLETIVLKCLDKESDRRYPTAEALARDLDRFSDGQEINARRAPAAAVVARKLKRQWVPVAAAGAFVIAAILLIVFLTSKSGSQELRALLTEGDQLAESGDLRGALVKYEAAKQYDPEGTKLKDRIAETTQRLKDRDRSEALRKDEAKGKAQPEIDLGRTTLQRARTMLYQSGADLSRMNSLLAQAIDHFTTALQYLPDQAELYDLRGQAYALRQQPAEAEKDFTAAIKALKTFSSAYYDRARIYLDLAAQEESSNWREKAQIDLEAYRKSGPGDREQMDFAEALLAASEKNYSKALQSCDRLIGRQTTNEEVYKLKGDLFTQMGHANEKEKRADFYRQAIQSYTEALTRRVNYPEAYLGRGHVQYAAGKPAEAVADWEKALSLGAARTDAILKKIAEVKQKLGS